MRAPRPRSPRPLVALLAGAALALGLLTPAASYADRRTPTPVLDGNFADPAVERYRKGFVGVATGEHAPRALTRTADGRWVRGGTALRTLPTWARAGDIWAADIQRIGGWWVLYFAAPVATRVPLPLSCTIRIVEGMRSVL